MKPLVILSFIIGLLITWFAAIEDSGPSAVRNSDPVASLDGGRQTSESLRRFNTQMTNNTINLMHSMSRH